MSRMASVCAGQDVHVHQPVGGPKTHTEQEGRQLQRASCPPSRVLALTCSSKGLTALSQPEYKRITGQPLERICWSPGLLGATSEALGTAARTQGRESCASWSPEEIAPQAPLLWHLIFPKPGSTLLGICLDHRHHSCSLHSAPSVPQAAPVTALLSSQQRQTQCHLHD